ncbi:MAG TPA: hypothetical protein VFE61_27830 [Candidatus Sulfotelmatobacter sp.]|jgi:hypothetical protein|nr:hypothetical protein [Candidatus Sulfotelmatobacter sp.]
MKARSKRWVLLLAIVGAICISVPLAGFARGEVQYHERLSDLSKAVKPGMRRVEVEAYLRSRKIEFDRMCGSGASLGAMHDLVEVGHKKAGLTCIERSVYVAFQFAAVEPNDKWVAASDRLVNIDLFRSVCLDLP